MFTALLPTRLFCHWLLSLPVALLCCILWRSADRHFCQGRMLSVLSLLVYYCRFLSLLVAAFCDTHQLLLPLFPAPVAVGWLLLLSSSSVDCCFCRRWLDVVAFVASPVDFFLFRKFSFCSCGRCHHLVAVPHMVTLTASVSASCCGSGCCCFCDRRSIVPTFVKASYCCCFVAAGWLLPLLLPPVAAFVVTVVAASW